MTDLEALDDGTIVDVEWRVFSNANPAAGLQPYYIRDLVMFVHTFDDTGETVLLLEQDWLDRQPFDQASYARSYAEGVPLDPDHPRFESLEVRDDAE